MLIQEQNKGTVIVEDVREKQQKKYVGYQTHFSVHHNNKSYKLYFHLQKSC